MTRSHFAITSSSKMAECERENLSALLLAKSRSCHRSAFSYEGMMKERTILANPHAFSAVIGFLLWAIVLLPTCFSASNHSPTSAISLRCRLRISWSNFSTLVATFAIHETHSMYRSLPTTCVVTIGTLSPRLDRINRCNSIASLPCAAPVPTAPRNLPTHTRS